MEATNGRLRASSVLPTCSNQEALELDRSTEESRPVPVSLHRVGTATSNRHNRSLVKLWREHVSLAVPHEACRDHLANERTFLSYVRCSSAFAMMGAIIAQLLRLEHSASPDPVLGFFVISIPLASICHVAAVIMTFVGCMRYLRWQRVMAGGVAISSGWELWLVGILTFAVSEQHTLLALNLQTWLTWQSTESMELMVLQVLLCVFTLTIAIYIYQH